MQAVTMQCTTDGQPKQTMQLGGRKLCCHHQDMCLFVCLLLLLLLLLWLQLLQLW